MHGSAIIMQKEPDEAAEEKQAGLFNGVRGTAIKILNRVERTDAYLDKLLEYELKNAEISGPDKALLYELVHGVVRWSGRLDWILSGFYKGQFSKALPLLKNTLRVALYQIMFLDKIPEYAAVNEAVEFIKKFQGQKPADITNAVLRNIGRSKNSLRYPDPETNLIGYYSTFYSHPAWLVKRWIARYGRDGAEQLMNANNERPYLTLRINQLKVSQEEFIRLMDTVNLKYNRGMFLDEFLKLQSLTNISGWQYFTEGYFGIQDESAGLACRLLGVEPNMRVLDMCAAPGGKAAYLADLMGNTGEIVALDFFESRLELLRQNNVRLGVTNVKTVAIDAHEYHDEKFDRILVDAPCTGLGTLSKKPDIKWKKELVDIHNINKLQTSLLEKASTLIKEGGSIVYSTCTIEPEENFEIVRNFLSSHPEFRLVNADGFVPKETVDANGCVQTLPHVHKTDGAFAARLEKFK